MKLAVFDATGAPLRIIAGPELHLVANLWMLPVGQETRVLDGTVFEHVQSLLVLEEAEVGFVDVATIPDLGTFDLVVAGGAE